MNDLTEAVSGRSKHDDNAGRRQNVGVTDDRSCSNDGEQATDDTGR